jgi:hypothetical protein
MICGLVDLWATAKHVVKAKAIACCLRTKKNIQRRPECQSQAEPSSHSPNRPWTDHQIPGRSPKSGVDWADLTCAGKFPQMSDAKCQTRVVSKLREYQKSRFQTSLFSHTKSRVSVLLLPDPLSRDLIPLKCGPAGGEAKAGMLGSQDSLRLWIRQPAAPAHLMLQPKWTLEV